MHRILLNSKCDSNETGDYVGEKPIFFISHRLSPTQCKYSTIEKECYSIFYSLSKLHHYLHNAEFVIKSDHKPLKYLLESPMQNKKIQLWALSIAGYNCKIEYIPGKKNIIADFLSRPPKTKIKNNQCDQTELELDINDKHFTINSQINKQDQTREINVIDSTNIDHKQIIDNIITPQPLPVDDTASNDNISGLNMQIEQEKDPHISEIKARLRLGKQNKSEDDRYLTVDDILYYISNVDEEPTLRLFVPKHLTDSVVKQYHDENGHPGSQRLFQTLKEKYYWPKMFKELNDYVSKCIICQSRNLKAIKAPISSDTSIPPFPFSVVSIDICGPYPKTLSGNRYIICFVDQFSGYIEAFASPDKSSDSVIHLLMNEIYCRHSCPIRIITDNGKEFTSTAFTETLKSMNIDHVKTTIYHPASNGMNERSHGTMNNILSKRVQENVQQWDVHLNMSLAAMRFCTSETSKHTPFFLLFNRDPILPIDNLLKPRRKYHGEDYHKIILEEQHKSFKKVCAQIQKSKRRQADYANKNTKDIKFEINDPVYYKNFQRTNKLDSKWRPYYRIIEQKSPLTYVIKNQLDNSTIKVHADQIRHANIDEWPMIDKPLARPIRKANLAFADDTLSSDSDSNTSVHGLPVITQQTRQIRDNTDDEENIPLAELQKHLRNKQFADIQSSSSESDTMHYNNGNSQNSPVRRFENDSSDDQMQIDAVALKHKKRKLTKKTSRSNNAMKKAIFTCLQTMAEHM